MERLTEKDTDLAVDGRGTFLAQMGVTHETMEKMDRYAAMLAEWNQKFNLVSRNSLSDIWTRHFLDSAQLVRHIPPSPEKTPSVYDIGAGAGFPGLVLSIMGVPGVNLVESIGKKATFLRAVVEELGLDVVVHPCRVESMKGLKADILTARAVAPLPELLPLLFRLSKKDTICLLLKGQSLDAELTDSQKYWTFDCQTFPSLSSESGRVAVLRSLKPRHAEKARFRASKKR